MANFASLRTSHLFMTSKPSAQNAQDLFRLLVENSTDIITVITEDGTIRYENPRVQDIFGYTPSERVGANAFDLIHPEDSNYTRPIFKELLEGGYGTIKSSSFRYRHKDGSWRHVDSVGINLLDDPLIKGILVNSHDVSDLKNSEAMLTRKEKELKAAQRIARVGSWRWDVLSGNLEWSDELYAIYGLEENVPVSYQVFLNSAATDEEREYIERVISNALETKDSFSYVHAIKLPNGEVRYLDSRGRVNVNDEGNAVELVGVCRDITSEWETQRELAETNKRLEGMVQERTRELNRINDMLIEEYDRMNFLSQAGAILASSLDYKETLKNLAAFVVPHYADWCAIDIVDAAGDLEQFTVAHKDKEKVSWAEQLHNEYPPQKESEHGVYEAVRTRKTLFFPTIDSDFIEKVAHDHRHLELLKGVGFTSAIIVPLYVGSKSIGAISFMRSTHDSNSVYTERDVKFFERLSHKASSAIHNAQIYTQAQEELEKRRELEQRWMSTYKELNKANKLLEHHITELEYAKSALEHEKAKDEAILENIGEGLIVVDENDYVILTNRTAEKLLKFDRASVIGKHAGHIIKMLTETGEVVPFSQCPLGKTRYKTTSQISTSDNRYYQRRDGSVFPVSVIASQFAIDGKRKGAVVVFKDVSKEKEIDNAKNEFVSIASHQLRTPLSTINWYTETLLMQAEEKEFGEKPIKYIRRIHAANHRLIRLVNSLLNVSRLELGTIVVEPVAIHLDKLVKEIVGDQKGDIMERGIMYEEEFEECLPPVSLDPRVTQIILQNIISNAIKYIPSDRDKKLVSVKMYMGSPPIRGAVPKRDTKDGIIVEVSDNGYGISYEDRKKIFGKFFRADVTQESNSEGSGLGLYIAKQLTELMGGKIWLRSRVNKGTTFYVFLPKQNTHAQLPLHSERIEMQKRSVGNIN